MMVGMRAALFAPVTGGTGAFHGIDALRGLAALTVVLFHYKNFIYGGPAPADVTMERLGATPLFQVIGPLAERGPDAVMLFWLISGFVFTHVYAGRAEKSGLRNFWAHRFSRLYPLHFTTLIVVALLQLWAEFAYGRSFVYHNQDLKHFTLQLFMASNWGFEDGNSFNGPIWSVSIEIAIYAAFFLFLQLPRFTLAGVGAALAGFMAVFLALQSQIALCGVYFFGGAGAYLLHQRLASRPLAEAVCGGGLIVLGLIAPGPATISLLLIFCGMVVLTAGLERLPPGRLFPRLRWLGDISYSIYLVHSPLIIGFLCLVAAGIVDLRLVLEPLFTLGYLVITCLVGRLAYLRLEKPAQRILREKLAP